MREVWELRIQSLGRADAGGVRAAGSVPGSCGCGRCESCGFSPWVVPMQEVWELQLQSLGREDPLQQDTATHSSIPAWRFPWAEECGGLQCKGSQRVGHDWSDLAQHTTTGLKQDWMEFSYTEASDSANIINHHLTLLMLLFFLLLRETAAALITGNALKSFFPLSSCFYQCLYSVGDTNM